MSEWLPIENAPRGESIILGSPNGLVCIGRLEPYDTKQGEKALRPRAVIGAAIYYPTHWMPLPAPPTSANTEAAQGTEDGIGIK